ncbi:hypothetical protein [Nocardia wallacei]|uniref:hypothetical protein n=1 Tax=Nocardia wallacei TaxID=480035 RepID=UPI002455DDF0|nr:hypothetical protein [Nocardia wallacei]
MAAAVDDLLVLGEAHSAAHGQGPQCYRAGNQCFERGSASRYRRGLSRDPSHGRVRWEQDCARQRGDQSNRNAVDDVPFQLERVGVLVQESRLTVGIVDLRPSFLHPIPQLLADFVSAVAIECGLAEAISESLQLVQLLGQCFGGTRMGLGRPSHGGDLSLGDMADYPALQPVRERGRSLFAH